MSEEIHYTRFLNLGIQYRVIKRNWTKKDPSIFYKFYAVCREYKPDIIHVWGNMVAIYAIPAKLFLGIPLVNFQIQTAPKKVSKGLLSHVLTFPFSDIVVANSYAGLKAFNAPKYKSIVIHNGFSFDRIENLENPDKVKKRLNIKTKYVVGMIAAFHETKDYKSYIIAANHILNVRKDVTFLGVGGGDRSIYEEMICPDHRSNILLIEAQQNVESIMNICDIGILATFTEGISNSLVEFMALGKPIIATDGGGTNELIIQGKTGFMVGVEESEMLFEKIIFLIENTEIRLNMGRNGNERIKNNFSITAMVQGFDDLHNTLLKGSKAIKE